MPQTLERYVSKHKLLQRHYSYARTHEQSFLPDCITPVDFIHLLENLPESQTALLLTVRPVLFEFAAPVRLFSDIKGSLEDHLEEEIEAFRTAERTSF